MPSNSPAKSVDTYATLLLIAIVVVALIVHLVDISSLSLLAIDAVSSLHAPGFGVISVLLLLIARARVQTHKAYSLAFLIAMAIGVLAEAAQYSGPRSADLSDIGANFVGTVGFLGAAALIDPSVRRPGKPLLLVGLWAIVAGALVASLVMPAIFAGGLIARKLSEPELASFNRYWEHLVIAPRSEDRLSYIPRPGLWPADTGGAVMVTANRNNRLLFRVEPYPDWSGYKSLVFDISSANDQRHKVTLLIRDGFRRRPFSAYAFQKELILDNSLTRLRIDLDEIRSGPRLSELDMSNISTIMLLAEKSGGQEQLLIGAIRLE